MLDTFLPRYHVHERHSRFVAAPRRAVWEAIERVTIAEMPLAGALFALRSLPARLSGRPTPPRVAHQPLLGHLLHSGFVRLGEDSERELVLGVIGQMWKPRGEMVEIEGAADFLAFERAGFVKAAMNFRLSDERAGTWLETETRVLATDPHARSAFGRYWLVIRPASGLIRRIMLRAIARRASGRNSR